MKKIYQSLIALAIMGISMGASAQIKTPAPSPTSSIKQAFGLGEINISYSRPSAKGRVIFGDIVPFDKIWRTGANGSSKITFSDDVTIDGNKLVAGEYALYTIPSKTEWVIIFHKNIKLWGLGDPGNYKEENDALRIKVKPSAILTSLETFEISTSDLGMNSATVNLSWEKTKVSFKVVTDVDSKIMASIEKTFNPKPEAGPYYNAASYYYESGKDLSKAFEWINIATSINTEAYWMMLLKAKILKKQNNFAEAIVAANISKELALKDGNDDYVAMNDKLIAECNAASTKKK